MNIKPLHHTWKLIGIPALAAGIALGAAPAAAGAHDTVDTDLTKGASGSEVEELQTLLEDRGLLQSSDINGTYDETTASAIKDFQNKYNLNEDGIAGPVTVGALEILSQGDEGEAVQYLQENLSTLGHYEGEADGVFTAELNDAVIDFQRSQNILVDGLAGPQTFGTVNAEIKEAEQAEQRRAEQEEAETSESHNEDVAAESSSSEQEGRTIQVSATAYTADCAGCSGVTSTGVDLNANPGAKVIAVDPNVIPLGSKVHIEGYGTYTAADTGGSIHGNKIDVHMPNKSAAYDFGRRNLEVTILN